MPSKKASITELGKRNEFHKILPKGFFSGLSLLTVKTERKLRFATIVTLL